MSCTRASIYRQPRAELRVRSVAGRRGRPVACCMVYYHMYSIPSFPFPLGCCDDSSDPDRLAISMHYWLVYCFVFLAGFASYTLLFFFIFLTLCLIIILVYTKRGHVLWYCWTFYLMYVCKGCISLGDPDLLEWICYAAHGLRSRRTCSSSARHYWCECRHERFMCVTAASNSCSWLYCYVPSPCKNFLYPLCTLELHVPPLLIRAHC